MPKKIRELKAMVAKVGYILQQKRGKGSHTFWKHPLLPEEELKKQENENNLEK